MSTRIVPLIQRPSFSLVVASAVTLWAVAGAQAQSGSRSPAPVGSGTSAAASHLALEGYCPVCVVKMHKWVKGSPEHQTTYDGKTYYFPSDQQRQMFLANPAQFAPALGGDCTVCYSKMGKRMAGSIHHSAIYSDRLFLFPNDNMKQMFLANPKTFANVDLALDGKCAVCLTKMNQLVAGKPEFTAIYHGFRYQFPSDQQRALFLQNPDRIADNAKKALKMMSSAAGSGTTSMITIQGTSTCAGCEYGISPLGAPKTLGLAINAPDGHVFVVEDAHTLYPDVYKNRYDHLHLQVSGRVLKQQGNIAWIVPSQLRVLN